MVEVTKTARGFEIIRFQDIYGEDCTLQESSLADRCAIWFGAGDNRMHLDADVFADLLPHIFRMLGLVEASVAAKDVEIAKLQEIVRTQAEEAAKATYYYTDKMDELKKECDALAGALRAHEQHMGEAQHTCVRYLVPAADPIRIEKEQFVSEMLGHFDGPEQRAVQEKANAALAQYAAI